MGRVSSTLLHARFEYGVKWEFLMAYGPHLVDLQEPSFEVHVHVFVDRCRGVLGSGHGAERFCTGLQTSCGR